MSAIVSFWLTPPPPSGGWRNMWTAPYKESFSLKHYYKRLCGYIGRSRVCAYHSIPAQESIWLNSHTYLSLMCLTLGYSTTIFLNILKFAWNFDFFSKMTQRQIRQARLGHMGMEQQRQKATELELQALSSISSFTDRIVAEQTPFQPVVLQDYNWEESIFFFFYFCPF